MTSQVQTRLYKLADLVRQDLKLFFGKDEELLKHPELGRLCLGIH